jgi:hypothetical protein
LIWREPLLVAIGGFEEGEFKGYGSTEEIVAQIPLRGAAFDLLVVATSGLAGSVTQMAGEVLVHLEHSHFVLPKDPPELVVGQDFAAVLRVL